MLTVPVPEIAMHLRPLAAIALSTALLAGCATMGASSDPTAGLDNPEVTSHTEANGDVVEEYRVAGQLRVVKVVPRTGVTYYLIDHDGDGRPDAGDPSTRTPVTYYKLFGW